MFLDVIHAPEQHVAEPETSVEGENLHNGAEVCDPLDNEEEGSVIDEEVVEPSTEINENNIVTSHDSTAVQDDAPRKSYASIVRKSSYGFLLCGIIQSLTFINLMNFI